MERWQQEIKSKIQFGGVHLYIASTSRWYWWGISHTSLIKSKVSILGTIHFCIHLNSSASFYPTFISLFWQCFIFISRVKLPDPVVAVLCFPLSFQLENMVALINSYSLTMPGCSGFYVLLAWIPLYTNENKKIFQKSTLFQCSSEVVALLPSLNARYENVKSLMLNC